jgi:hypothetical protein
VPKCIAKKFHRKIKIQEYRNAGRRDQKLLGKIERMAN